MLQYNLKKKSRLGLTFVSTQFELLTGIRTKAFVFFLTGRAADVLQMAIIVGAINKSILGLVAMMAFAHDNILIGLVDGDGFSFIKYITFAVKKPTFDILVFAVGYDTAIQLGNVRKSFL